MKKPFPIAASISSAERESQDPSPPSSTQAPDFAAWQKDFAAGYFKTRTGYVKTSPEDVKMIPSPDGRSRLLELPAELRMMVFAELFASYSSMTIESPYTTIPKLGQEMAILRTCKRINAEASEFIPEHHAIECHQGEPTIDIPTRIRQHNFAMVSHIELLISELRPGKSSFVLRPWRPILKLLQTQAPALRSLTLRRLDRRPTSIGLLDALDDAPASKARKREIIMFLAAIFKIKQLRTLTIHAKVGSAGLARLEKGLGKELKLNNSRGA